uniref:Zinc finger, CCHC-type n=1 Tax=Tanacetum cinerariifolium TaxID=118510 RepID=A0A699JZN4_TANCI|nr:zinc finger, CCHC-type [Tanacetum cinerariifolium]
MGESPKADGMKCRHDDKDKKKSKRLKRMSSATIAKIRYILSNRMEEMTTRTKIITLLPWYPKRSRSKKRNLGVRKNLVYRSLLNKFDFKLVFESDKFILSKAKWYCRKKESHFDRYVKLYDVLSGLSSRYWGEALLTASANDEMDSIIGNNTWILVDLPPGSKAIKSKWIFKRKLRVDGSIEKLKARLVAKGFTQRGLD